MSDTKNQKRLSKHAITILINHAIFQFGGSLSIIFVNLYLWRLTNSIWINGMYNLIAIFAQAITTFYIGKMSKKKGRTTIYRYGILMSALFYLFIVLVQEQMVEYFYLFALLRGIAQGLYWVAYFTIVHEVSSNTNRHRYLGWNQVVMGSTNLIAPAFAGAVIGYYSNLTGYMIVFSIAFLMFFICTIGSFRIRKESIRHRNYYMKYLPLMLKRQKGFRNALIGWFVIGFPQGILMYVPAILIYSIFQDESIVGYLNASFLLVSIIVSFIFSRNANVKNTERYLWIAAIGFVLSGAFLTWEIATWSVIVFMVTQNMFKPLQANAYAAYYFQWIDHIPLQSEFRVESIVLRETIINIGRGLGILAFMLFAEEMDTNMAAYVIFLAMMMQLVLPLIIHNKKGVMK